MHFVMHMCLLAAHDGELWQWALKSLKCCERKMAMGAGCVNLVLNVGGRNKHDTVFEWPRRWTRNPLGSARRGLKSPRCRMFGCNAVFGRQRRKGSGAIASKHCLACVMAIVV